MITDHKFRPAAGKIGVGLKMTEEQCCYLGLCGKKESEHAERVSRGDKKRGRPRK
jgi:hypothetical protein